MEERSHPTPFRTRQLSSPSPMILQSLLWESRSPPSLCQAPAPRHAPGAFGVCGADGRAAARASRARPEPWARRQRGAIPTEGARQGPCDGAQMGGPWLRCGAESGEWYPKAGERWPAGAVTGGITGQAGTVGGAGTGKPSSSLRRRKHAFPALAFPQGQRRREGSGRGFLGTGQGCHRVHAARAA